MAPPQSAKRGCFRERRFPLSQWNSLERTVVVKERKRRKERRIWRVIILLMIVWSSCWCCCRLFDMNFFEAPSTLVVHGFEQTVLQSRTVRVVCSDLRLSACGRPDVCHNLMDCA